MTHVDNRFPLSLLRSVYGPQICDLPINRLYLCKRSLRTVVFLSRPLRKVLLTGLDVARGHLKHSSTPKLETTESDRISRPRLFFDRDLR